MYKPLDEQRQEALASKEAYKAFTKNVIKQTQSAQKELRNLIVEFYKDGSAENIWIEVGTINQMTLFLWDTLSLGEKMLNNRDKRQLLLESRKALHLYATAVGLYGTTVNKRLQNMCNKLEQLKQAQATPAPTPAPTLLQRLRQAFIRAKRSIFGKWH